METWRSLFAFEALDVLEMVGENECKCRSSLRLEKFEGVVKLSGKYHCNFVGNNNFNYSAAMGVVGDFRRTALKLIFSIQL